MGDLARYLLWRLCAGVMLAAATMGDVSAACVGINFKAAPNVQIGVRPSGFVVTDFNRDGKPDLAVANLGEQFGSEISVYLGTGTGSFGAPINYNVGLRPTVIVINDYNNDGLVDMLVLSTYGNQNIAIMLGDGAGGFQAPRIFDVGTFFSNATAGDVNSDGKVDVVLTRGASSPTSGGKFFILLGNGDGSFAPPSSYDTVSGTNPVSSVVGDFNRDGRADIAIANFTSPIGSVGIYLSEGNGQFRSTGLFSTGEYAGSIIVRDLNTDNNADLVVGGFNSITILLGDGQGRFRPSNDRNPTIKTLDGNRSTVLSDFNNDGRVDLVTADDVNTVTVRLGTEPATFSDPVVYRVGRNPGILVASDFNLDGRLDLAVTSTADANISVLLNTCNEIPFFPTGVQFASSSYSTAEGAGSVQVIVIRNGDLSTTGSLDYATGGTALVRCDEAIGNALDRCDFLTATGTLTFAPGQRQKSIRISIIDDAYQEGDEVVPITLGNPRGGVSLGSDIIVTTLTIIDNDSVAPPPTNPIDTAAFFVRQQYLDFLSREPEAEGRAAWEGVLNRCPSTNDASCDRVTVSSSFFRSDEFLQFKGFFVYRFYTASFGRRPRYFEMTADMARISGETREEVLAKQEAFTAEWINRPDFKATYDQLSNASFIDKLLQTAGINLPQRNDLVAALNDRRMTRAQALRAIIDSSEVAVKEYNRAFVLMQYFGYLRRDPDEEGYQSWLRYLNANPMDFRTMVHGFVNSAEYRLRFSRF